METIKKALAERVGGGRPAPIRAFVAATVAGTAICLLVFNAVA
jgi:hypothetical protein